LDVRTPAEFAAVHVPTAQSLPLDALDAAVFQRQRGAGRGPVFVLCQSGARAARAISRLEQGGVKDCVLVEGGTQAWIDAGLPVVRGPGRVISLLRQMQITVGVLSATGALLALVSHPLFAVIPLLTGCGLVFAGISGTCGMVLLLARMPWNRGGQGCSASQ